MNPDRTGEASEMPAPKVNQLASDTEDVGSCASGPLPDFANFHRVSARENAA